MRLPIPSRVLSPSCHLLVLVRTSNDNVRLPFPRFQTIRSFDPRIAVLIRGKLLPFRFRQSLDHALTRFLRSPIFSLRVPSWYCVKNLSDFLSALCVLCGEKEFWFPDHQITRSRAITRSMFCSLAPFASFAVKENLLFSNHQITRSRAITRSTSPHPHRFPQFQHHNFLRTRFPIVAPAHNHVASFRIMPMLRE